MLVAVEAILTSAGLALTPLERYSAMRRLNSHHPIPDSMRAFLTHPWFIWGGILLIVILLISLVVVRRNGQFWQGNTRAVRLSVRSAGLTARNGILQRSPAAGSAGRKIFSSQVVHSSASKLMQEYFASGII
jgi:hypothetical protein